MAATVTTKKKCCTSSPRCKNCPLVWKRLADEGLAERSGKRTWRLLAGKIPKKVMKAARRR